jgi:(S)-3,5-dihydroxyphenylglycine transaminase
LIEKPAASAPWLSADELEQLARRRLPADVYDYVAGGAGEELTLAANRQAFERLRLRPRVLTGVSRASTETSLLGMKWAAPIFISPMGTPAHDLVHPHGVAGTAAAADDNRVGYMLSASSAASLDIPGENLVCQVYVIDREGTAELVSEAARRGYRAVCLTVDVPVPGLRRRNLRHGRGLPAGQADAARDGFANPEFYARPVTWDDVEWLRSLSPLPLLVKGVMTAEDARLALDHGAQGVVVSNHGGRQLDHALATIDVLPEVVEEVAGRAAVLVDGGVRTSTDLVVALALGADAVGLGKAVMWALAANGRDGVSGFIRFLIDDLARTMTLIGAGAVTDLGPAFVDRRYSPLPQTRR